MIEARYNEDGSIILDLKLIGKCNDKVVTTLMDTGFSGAIALPVSLGCELGLEPVGDASVIVASGEVVDTPIFIGKLEIGGDIKDCIFIVLSGSSEVLLGMEIVKDYNVEFHGAQRKISIQKAAGIKKAEERLAIEPTEAPAPVEPVVEPPPPEVPKERVTTLKKTLREVVGR